MMKVAKIIGLLLVALMVFVSGCSRAIPFESIAGGIGHDGGGFYSGENARVYVISSNQTLPVEVLNWLQPYDRETVLKVDYSKYFMVVAFNGYRGAIWTTFYIQRIQQRSDVISITALFNDRNGRTSGLTAESSQYQAVKISRDQIPQTGVITFRLLDETGKESARVTSNLDK